MERRYCQCMYHHDCSQVECKHHDMHEHIDIGTYSYPCFEVPFHCEVFGMAVVCVEEDHGSFPCGVGLNQ